MGCPWVYLVKWPNGHNGMPLGIKNRISTTGSMTDWEVFIMMILIQAICNGIWPFHSEARRQDHESKNRFCNKFEQQQFYFGEERGTDGEAKGCNHTVC